MQDRSQFIKDQTRVRPVAHAPEIELHLADEAVELWLKTEEELGELGLEPPFWAFAWAGGQALARYILDTPGLVRGKRVLDFACGSGLIGIAAMKAGASRCDAVDIDPFAIEAARLNSELNGVELMLHCRDITSCGAPDAELVFCGDVFYDKNMAERTLGLLDRYLRKGVPILVGDPGRSYLPVERLDRLATFEVPGVGALEDLEVKKSSVFRFKPI
nr:50S ribosomal protein L11 methyltransferase [Roseibium aquae]